MNFSFCGNEKRLAYDFQGWVFENRTEPVQLRNPRPETEGFLLHQLAENFISLIVRKSRMPSWTTLERVLVGMSN